MAEKAEIHETHLVPADGELQQIYSAYWLNGISFLNGPNLSGSH